MRILAIATAYNPDITLFIQSITTYIPRVDHLLIWRNSPINEDGFFDSLSAFKDKIEFVGDGENVGISKALNYAWRYAEEYGYTHLFTMDQDSLWENFDVFLFTTEGLKGTKAFFAPGVNQDAIQEPTKPAETMITSGMLVPLQLLRETGGYREDFTIDGIDNDLFYHAKALGWEALTIGGCALHQRFGNPQYHKFLKWRIGTLNYSAKRLYTIYRNNYIVIHSYPGTDAMRKRFRKSCGWSRPIRILLAEKDKIAKFRSMFRGIRDAKRYLRKSGNYL